MRLSIFDENGKLNRVERLLGHGDMLSLPADQAEPVGIQGLHVSIAQPARVVERLVAVGEAVHTAAIDLPVDTIAEVGNEQVRLRGRYF